LPVKAKTSRTARFTVGAGLDSQSPPVFLVAKGGIPPKPACAGFFHNGRKVCFPESAADDAGTGGGRVCVLGIIKNASHGEQCH